ncbi:MAG: pyridoxamine 5'-phosphate oxidase [Flavobacteriales bacterium]|nr:pyridoxamine 5'-phosphate oxidase [Flavobacteriales bacterium]
MENIDIFNSREDYNKSKIDFNCLPENPMLLFEKWIAIAVENNNKESIPFVLSTVSIKNIPSSRVVLLRNILNEGLFFYTNYNSKKSKDIEVNNVVAANFFWKDLEKQIRVTGEVNKISNELSDVYFASRPRNSQLSAWSSNQSEILDFNFDLDDKVNFYSKKFFNQDVKRPDNWGGYCINPHEIEFWQGRPSRLHDRIKYFLDKGKWHKMRISP